MGSTARRGPPSMNKEGSWGCGQKIHKEQGHGGPAVDLRACSWRPAVGGVRPAQSSEGSRYEHRLDTSGTITFEFASLVYVLHLSLAEPW